MSRVTIVLGCHRSGTSLVANILHDNGIVMGEEENFKPKANTTNEKGFFENYLFRRINDKILEEHGHVVKDWDMSNTPKVEATTAGIFNEMNRLIVRYNRLYKNFGAKDPRFCLTLPVWKKVLPTDTRFLFVYRHPIEVANSLVARGDVETVEDGLKIWGAYNMRAFIDLQGTNVVFVNYNDLIETGEIGDTGLLGHGIINKSLRHHNDLDVPNKYGKLWAAISGKGETHNEWYQ